MYMHIFIPCMQERIWWSNSFPFMTSKTTFFWKDVLRYASLCGFFLIDCQFFTDTWCRGFEGFGDVFFKLQSKTYYVQFPTSYIIEKRAFFFLNFVKIFNGRFVSDCVQKIMLFECIFPLKGSRYNWQLIDRC